MDNVTHGRHVEALRREIIAIINDVLPKSIIPEVVFTRSKIARSQLEVTIAIRKLCGEGVLELSPCSENAYRLKEKSTARPSSSAPLSTPIPSTQVKSKTSKTNQVLAYIKENGPTETPILSKKFGDSTYSFLQSLVDQNLICLAGTKGNTKIWSLPEDADKVPEDELSKTDKIFKYIEDNEPVEAVELAEKYGHSTHTFLQNLRRRNLIERAGKDGRKSLWRTVKADAEPESDAAPEPVVAVVSTSSQGDIMVNHGVPATDDGDFKILLENRRVLLEVEIEALVAKLQETETQIKTVRRQIDGIDVLLEMIVPQ